MALLPKTHCPGCNGPVTFFEVMSIVTPFQSIDCSTCGEMIFLKHNGKLFLIALGLTVLFVLFSIFVLINRMMPALVIYGMGFFIFAAAEFLITARIVRQKDLVVRRNK